eukprot:evm.model.scf_507.1 EVM.evm.TU.scf_507.1   scf_507:3710-6539(+)
MGLWALLWGSDSYARSNDTVHEKKLVAGGPAEACRYPYVASLGIRDLGGAHICSGTLVDESWVMTAASCVDKSLGRKVTKPVAFLNGLLQSMPETFQENIPTVEADLHIHPKYGGDPVSGYNVALLKLESPSKQPPLKLTGGDDSLEPGELVGLIGWYRYGGTGAFASTLLETTDVELEGPDVCSGFGAKDTAKVFCAGHQEFCQGDEGSPVLRLGEDASGDVQVGVVVGQGVECGLFGKPLKFTGLQHLLDWINGVVNGTR